MENIHICWAGPTYTIDIAGIKYPFEFHKFCGPMPLKKNGEPRNIAHNHRFWHAVTFWCKQGEKVDDQGNCIYDQPDWIIRRRKQPAEDRG